MRSLHLGEALSDILVLRDLAILQEVLVTPSHLEQVGALELLHDPHLVRLALDLVGVSDGLVDGVSDHVERRVLVVDGNLGKQMSNIIENDMIVQFYRVLLFLAAG